MLQLTKDQEPLYLEVLFNKYHKVKINLKINETSS
jgi:hypothetical protein